MRRFAAVVDDLLGNGAHAGQAADIAAPVAHGLARQYQRAGGIDKIDVTVEARLVAVDDVAHGVQGQADAGGADELAVVVNHAVVDEDGHAVAVGHVDVDIRFIIGLVHGAHAVVPDVARLLRADGFQGAFRVIIFAALVRDEKAGDGAVLLLDLGQVAHDLLRLFFAGQYPVAHEGVVRHQRRDEDGAQHVLLDFRVNVVARQGQGLVGDAVFDGLARSQVAGQAGRHEARSQDQGQEDEQAVLDRQKTHGDGERPAGRLS